MDYMCKYPNYFMKGRLRGRITVDKCVIII